MDKQRYTTTSLAKLLGMPRNIVYNARGRTQAKPNSQIHAVLEGMRRHGISWEQVELDPGGKKAARETPCEPVPPAHPEPVEQEPSVSTYRIPQHRQSISRHTDSRAIAGLLDTDELETELRAREQGSQTPDRVGACITLEDLLLELGRRLPNARLVFHLPQNAETGK